MSDKDLSQIQTLLDVPLPMHKDLTAILMDEEDEQGPVKLVNKDGAMIMMMPRSVYDELMNYNE